MLTQNVQLILNGLTCILKINNYDVICCSILFGMTSRQCLPITLWRGRVVLGEKLHNFKRELFFYLVSCWEIAERRYIQFLDSCQPYKWGVKSATQTVRQTRIQRHSDEGGGFIPSYRRDLKWIDWNEPSISCLGGVGSLSVWRSEWWIEPLPHLADMNSKTGLYPLSERSGGVSCAVVDRSSHVTHNILKC